MRTVEADGHAAIVDVLSLLEGLGNHLVLLQFDWLVGRLAEHPGNVQATL